MRSINRSVRGRTYLCSLRNSTLILSDIREELHRRDRRELCALAWRWVVQVDDRAGALLGPGVREDEFLHRLIGRFRAIEDTSHVIPWGKVVRCKRDLPLSVPDVSLSVRNTEFRGNTNKISRRMTSSRFSSPCLTPESNTTKKR